MPSAFGKPVTTANRFGAAPSANGFKLITTLTANASASLSYTAFDASAYQTYCCVMEDLQGMSAGSDFYLDGSIDGGATYGSLFYYTLTSISNVTVTGAAQAGAALRLAMIVSSAANRGLCGTMYLTFGSKAGQRSQVWGQTTYNTNTPTRETAIFGGYYDSATSVNALKWYGGGNITTGTIHIYGLQKA